MEKKVVKMEKNFVKMEKVEEMEKILAILEKIIVTIVFLIQAAVHCHIGHSKPCSAKNGYSENSSRGPDQ